MNSVSAISLLGKRKNGVQRRIDCEIGEIGGYEAHCAGKQLKAFMTGREGRLTTSAPMCTSPPLPCYQNTPVRNQPVEENGNSQQIFVLCKNVEVVRLSQLPLI